MKKILVVMLAMLSGCTTTSKTVASTEPYQVDELKDYKSKEVEQYSYKPQSLCGNPNKELSNSLVTYTNCFKSHSAKYKKSKDSPDFIAIAVAEECSSYKSKIKENIVNILHPRPHCGDATMGSTTANIEAEKQIEQIELKSKQRVIQSIVQARLNN